MLFDPALTKAIKFTAGDGHVNTSEETMIEYVRHNIRLGLPQVRVFDPNPHVALLVCGGPSLDETEEELVKLHWAGGRIVAVNGAYEWCIKRNLRPSAAVVLDAREFNSRFIERPVEGCRYLLASQCHPKTFEICRGRETFIWHACASQGEADILKEYYFDRFHQVDIGVTIGIRSLSLLRMLGFGTQHVFGLDSCYLDNKHHAYAQPENDKDENISVWLCPNENPELARMFKCAAWHIKQGYDFMEFMAKRGDKVMLKVHGPGLIAYILECACNLQIKSATLGKEEK